MHGKPLLQSTQTCYWDGMLKYITPSNLEYNQQIFKF